MPLKSETKSLVEEQVENGKSITLDAIATDLNNDLDIPLYLASEVQIDNLIQQGRIDEDFSSRYQNAQEELRVMKADAGFMTSFYEEVQAGVGASMKANPNLAVDMDNVTAVEGVDDKVQILPHEDNES